MLPTLLLRVHCVANSGDFEGGKGKAAELVHHLCRRAFEVTGICHSSPHGRPTMMVGLQAARGRRRRHRNRRPMSRTQLNIINTRVSSPLQVNTRKFHRTKTAKAFSLVHRERRSHCITRRCYPSSSCPNRLPACAHVRHTPGTERKKRQRGGGQETKKHKRETR